MMLADEVESERCTVLIRKRLQLEDADIDRSRGAATHLYVSGRR